MKKILSIAVLAGLLIGSLAQQAAAEPTGGWTEKTIFERDFSHKDHARRYALLKVHGHPREGSSEMYDLDVTVSDTVTRTVTMRTFGLWDEEFEAEAVEIPPSTTRLHLKIAGRYDASQPGFCVSETASGCVLKIPTDPTWVTSPSASEAALIVSVTAYRDDAELTNQTIELPYLGQLTG